MSLNHFHHIFIDNNAKKTLFLLHGTGADEHDLLPLVTSLKKEYNFVGLRGNDESEGMTRFFERRRDGTFNQESINIETKKLSEFLEAWYEKYSLKVEDVAFLGYSNGANMILATLFYYPQLISKGVLLHCKLPFNPDEIELQNKSFLVSYGERDQMISAEESREVIETLKHYGSKVDIVTHPGGHEIVRDEVQKLTSFLT